MFLFDFLEAVLLAKVVPVAVTLAVSAAPFVSATGSMTGSTTGSFTASVVLFCLICFPGGLPLLLGCLVSLSSSSLFCNS